MKHHMKEGKGCLLVNSVEWDTGGGFDLLWLVAFHPGLGAVSIHPTGSFQRVLSYSDANNSMNFAGLNFVTRRSLSQGIPLRQREDCTSKDHFCYRKLTHTRKTPKP